MRLHRGQRLGAGRLPQSDFFAGTVLDQLGAAGDQIVEQDHLRIGPGGGCRLHRLAVVGQQQGIDGVGLGELATGPGKITRKARVDHADGDGRLVQGGDKLPVVRPGGFADDVDRCPAAGEDLDQGSITGGVIGDGGGNGELGATQVDGGFGDIGAEVDRRGEHG